MAISQPAIEDRNGIVIGYDITLTHVSSGAQMSYTTNELDQPFIATNLLPSTTYSYTVAARTIIGAGPSTASSLVTTTLIGQAQ